MAVSELINYLASFNPLSSQGKNKQPVHSKENVSLFPSKNVSVLKPDKMKEMDQCIALSNFFAILGGIKSAIHFVTSGIEAEGKRAYRYFSEHYYSYRLKEAVVSGFNALRGERAENETATREMSPGPRQLLAAMRTQSSPYDISLFLSDKAHLKELSYLKKAAEASPIDEEVFDAVFHGIGSYHAETLPKVIAYMKSCLPGELLPISRLSILEDAVRKDAEFRFQVSGAKAAAPLVQKEKLKTLAQQMVGDVCALKAGQSFVSLSGVRNGNTLECPLIDTIFSEFLPGDLHQLLVGKNSEEVIQSLSLKLKTAIWGEQEEMPGFRKNIEEKIRNYLHQAGRLTEAIFPEAAMSGIKSSLKQDLEEILFGPPTENGAERLGEQIWANLKEKGIEKVIQESLLEALQSSRQIIDAQMESVQELVSVNLPVAAKPILGTLGLLKGEEESVWFEFEKQANQKIKLTIYAQGSAAQPHPDGKVDGTQGLVLPLVYSNIDPASLDQAFFYTLLSYRALPEWDSSQSFSIQHIHDGLLASLKIKPDAPRKNALVSIEKLRGEGAWKYLLHFLKHHLDLPSAKFEKKYAYEVQLQAFIRMWGYVLDDPKYLQKHAHVKERFRVAISELSQKAVELYHEKQLSSDELKQLYATTWEAEQKLNFETPRPKTVASVVVPQDLQAMLKKLTLAIGVAPAHVSLIKEALMVVYGADIEDVVDQAFRDLLPSLTNDEMNEMRSKRSSDNLYTWTGIQKMGTQLKNFRFSLFHFVRLYVGVSKIFSDIFVMSVASRNIEFLLLACFPAITTYTSMSVGTLSRLLACFGPSLLKPVLPTPVYQSLRALCNLVKEAITYVKRRLIFVVVRIVTRVLLGGEKATQLSAQARNWAQKMNRSGEISYEIPYGKNEFGYLRLKPQKKPESHGLGPDPIPSRGGVGKIISPYGSTSELPRPYHVQLTKDNIKEELSKWVLEATVLGNDQGLGRSCDERDYQRLLYLNRQFRNLKLPGETGMWDEVDPLETMRLLDQVVSSMSNYTVEHLSTEELGEVLTTTYAAYAIMDHLARRLSDAKLPSELEANGCDLAVWLQSPATRVIRNETYIQLHHVARYFGFDLEKVYTEEEIDQRRTRCLFNYDGRGESRFTPAFMNKDGEASYLGFRRSKEGLYYQELLKNPEVQRRLEGCGVSPDAEDWEKFKKLFSNSKGTHGKPLPEAFDLLRKMDFVARRCVYNRSVETHVSSVEQRDNSWPWIFDNIRTCMHRFTGGLLRRQTFSRSVPTVDFTFAHDRGIKMRFCRRGIEHGFLSHGIKWRDENGAKLLRRLQQRSVNQVMASDPLSFKDLSVQEMRLLELINSDKDDQIMKVLGFFNRTKGRLREPRFRFLFDLLINRLGALQSQMKQRSNLSETMGYFFQEALEYFEKQEDTETCLYLTKIGQELSIALGAQPKDTFPDFRAFIRFRLIPYLRNVTPDKKRWKCQGQDLDLILLSYQHLILTYGSLDPEKAAEEERNQAIEDIARLVYTSLTPSQFRALKKPDVMVKADEVLYLWEPYVKEAMKKDPVLRKNVIESILRDIGMATMVEEDDEWKGTYPVFTNGRITLDLTQNTQTTHKISMKIAKERAEEVVPDLGDGIRLSERSFSFPEKKVIIEFAEGTFAGRTPCTVYRQFSGVDYEFLPRNRQELLQGAHPFDLPKEEELWLERSHSRRSRHLLCMKGEEKVWRRSVRESIEKDGSPLYEVRWNRQEIDGVFVREVNLENEPHGLALLSWFEEEKEIKAYAHVTHPDRLAFIEFPKKGLRFEVREHGGELRAMALGDATGYFISKEQRHEHLLKYGKYLLLENTLGQKKVYMMSKPLKTLMAEFILSNVGKIRTSPMIEHYINSLTPNFLDNGSTLLSFDLDEKGNLTTLDPMGLAYLALFNFIKGDTEASLRCFSELEDFGRKYPFPEKIYEIFELMYLPLLCSQDRFSREMALRLGAIQVENQFIQHHEDSGITTLPLKTSRTTRLLQWILMQVKYSEYLSAVRAGIPPTLNEYQELFLLTGIGAVNQDYYKEYLGSSLPETLQEFGQKIGLENLANSFLFQPQVMERYHELRLQLEKESKTTSMSRGLVLQAIQSIFANGREGERLEGKGRGTLGGVIDLVNQAKNSAFLRDMLTPTQMKSFYAEVEVSPDLRTLPTAIWEFDQTTLTRYFPLYYRLAKNERSWRVDAALFNQKRQELLRSLELMQRNDSSDASLKREILQEVSSGSIFYNFPTANRLENMIQRRQRAGELAEKQHQEEFDKFISDELISNCRKSHFSKRVIQSGAVPKVADSIFRMMPGFLLPFPLRVARFGREVYSLVQEVREEKGQVLHQGLRVGALFPEYDNLIWGLSFLPWVEKWITLHRGVQHENQRPVDLSSEVTSRARSELKKKPLEGVIANDLKRMDANINRAFDELFDQFFNGEMRPLPVDSRTVKVYETSSDDMTLKAAFREVNESLEDYYDRPFEKRLQVELKPGKNPQEFIAHVQEYIRAFAQHLEREETIIEQDVTANKTTYDDEVGERVVKKIQRRELGDETLDFGKIYELFTQCDDEAFLKRTEIRPDRWPNLKKRLYLYQTVRRRFNLIFNLVGQLKDGNFENIEMLAIELKRRPAYDLCQDVPELILRAKLSYEVALELMLYKTAKQSEQLDRLLLEHWEPTEKVVLQQIMGTGKTLLVPISDRVFADGESLVFNVVIDPVAPPNFELFTINGKKAFNQVGTILRFNRLMTWTTQQLWALQQVLQRATYLGEHLNVRQKDAQALELRYLEEMLDVDKQFESHYRTAEWKKRLTIYRDIFRLLAIHGIENSDEKHKLDDPTTNILNFPLGRALKMQKEEVKLMNEVMLLLVTIPELREYITIKSKRPEKLLPEVYREKVLPILAHQISLLESLEIPEEHRVEFVKYLKGEATAVPEFVNESLHKRAIGQAKGCVTVLLEYALQCLTNVDFTLSGNEKEEYSKPAYGNKDPRKDSTDLRPDINYIKTLMILFQTRLNQTQLKKLVIFLGEQARAEATKRGVHPQDTQAGRFFAMHCSGYQIDTWQAEDLLKVMEKLNQSDRAITIYAEEFIAPKISFYQRFLSSNFANFHSMFGKKQCSRTGTPKNWRCYPYNTKMLAHAGTEGESVHVLEKKIGPASIHVLEESDPKPALRELIYRFFHSNPKALAFIDLDPLCNNMSAQEVNEAFQRYIEEHRPELQGVVFYDQDKNLVIAEKGSSHTIPLSESHVPPNKRISLFTHTQTTASDIKQDKEAEAFMTVGENVTLTDLAQAFDRMREARRGAQQVSIVMTKRAHQRICKILGKSADTSLTMRDIISLAIENETNKLDPLYRLAASQILSDILYRAIRRKGDALPSIEETIAMHRVHQGLFINETEEDPFETYGYVDMLLEPEVALKNLRGKLLNLLSNCKYLDKSEKGRLKKEMESVRLDHSTGKVHVYKKGKEIVDHDQFLAQHAQQAQSFAQENECDQSCEVAMNTQVHVAQTVNAKTKMNSKSGNIHVGYQWPDDLDPYAIETYMTASNPSDWFKTGTVPIYSFQEFTKRRKELAFISDSLDQAIYISENLAQQCDNRVFKGANPIMPFGESQSPLYKALVIQDQKNGTLEHKILLLHHDEISFWRTKLEKLRRNNKSHPHLKLALYDFGTCSVEGDSIQQNDKFLKAIAQINFLYRGKLSYSKEDQKRLHSWIVSVGARLMRKAFEEVIYGERPVGTYQGSDLETVFFKAAGVPLDMRIRV